MKEVAGDFVTKSFDGDVLFKEKVVSEFEIFVNKNKNSPEYLAVYMDDLLKNVLPMVSSCSLMSTRGRC